MATLLNGEAGIYAVLAIQSAGSPAVFTTIANLIGDIGGLGGSSKMADVTPHGPSPWTIMIPTTNTWGPVTIDIAFVASSTGDGAAGFTSGLGAVWTNQQLRNYRVTFPDNTVEYFQAYISKYEIKAPIAGAITASVTFEGFGEPLLA